MLKRLLERRRAAQRFSNESFHDVPRTNELEPTSEKGAA